MSRAAAVPRLRVALPYRPFPRQAAFHACVADEVLFGGAAGPGKSLALLVEMFAQAVEVPGNDVILYRRTFPQLSRTLIRWSLEGAPGLGRPGRFPREVATYNEGRKVWTFAHGSRLEFAHVAHERAIYDYQGPGYGGAGVDELTEWSEGMYRFLLRLLRSTVPGVWPRLRATANPIGPGYAFVRARFVQPVLDGRARADEVWRPAPSDEDPQPMSRAYIPARHGDNPALSLNDPGYTGRLAQLPARERAALLEGSWELPAAEGAPFRPEDVVGAQDGAVGFGPARWRCPSCKLEFNGVQGSAACLVCHRPLRPREYLTAWDLARRVDWCVGITLDATDYPAQIVAFARFRRVPWPEVARRIEARAAAYPGRTLIDSSGGSVGDPMLEFIGIPVEGVEFGGRNKVNLVQALILALENGDIRGPASGEGIERLWEELLSYQWEDQELVQDCVMSLAMAAWALQESGPPRVWRL